jgi:hypothetical protein
MTGTALPGAARSAEGGHPWRQKFLEGDHAWGALSVSLADRSGSIRYHLTVFPPGISPEQRRALVFRRRWVGAGLFAWLIVAGAVGTLANGWLALGLGAAVYFGAFVVASARAGAARRDVVEVRAALVSLMGRREVFGDFDLLEAAVTGLEQLDRLNAETALNPVEYELHWGEIYRRIVAESKSQTSRT